ncbi:MAG: diguanylate cyclase [Burkholderiaceae bacterium]
MWLDHVSPAFQSLKLRLALTSVSVIALSVGLTVLLVTRDQRMRAERSIEDSTLDVDSVAKTLSSRLVNRELALGQAGAQWPAHRRAEPAQAMAFLGEQSLLTALFSVVFIADESGRVVAELSESGVHQENYSIKGRDDFERVLLERHALISVAPAGPATGARDVVIAVPVRDDEGRVQAVLGGVLHTQNDSLMTDSARSKMAPRDPIDTIICDSAGRILVHPDPALLQQDVGQDPDLAQAVTRWRKEGAPLESPAWAWRTGQQFVAMAPVPEAGWMVFRTASADLLLGEPAIARRETYLIGTLVTLIGALLILLTSARLLRPLKQLEQRALRLLDDDLALDRGWPVVGGEIGHLSAVFQHVLALRAASRRGSEQVLARMRAVMLNAPVGIGFTRGPKFELVSRHLGKQLGYGESELVGAKLSTLFPSEQDLERICNAAELAFSAGQAFQQEVALRHRDGHLFWAYLQGASVDDDGAATGVIWIVSDISELRRQRELLSWTASHDALTDLSNRRAFEEQLNALLHDRRHSEPAAALFIDLDGFKAVNDSAGHAAGDAILKDVAALLAGRVREGDLVARLGGDEFAVLLRACSTAAALTVAESIRGLVAGHSRNWQGISLRVGASIGVVAIDDSFGDIAAVLAAADAACYAAKRAGRNQVRLHQPPLVIV